MGGSDEESNLIYLTAGDHFMAHVLLAKAHNVVKLWRAVMIMSTGLENKKRRCFEIARKKFGELQRDPKIHVFKNIKTGGIINATRREMMDHYDFSRESIKQLILGDVKISNNFCLVDTEVPVEESHSFIDMNTGEIVTGTFKEISNAYNILHQEYYGLVRGTLNRAKNFLYANAHPDVLHFYMSPYVLKNIDTGEILTGSLKELQIRTGLNKLKLGRLVIGKVKRSENYVLIKSPAIDTGLKFRTTTAFK
jgi:hypothetical protein